MGSYTLLALMGNHDRVGDEVASSLDQGGFDLVRAHRKEDDAYGQFAGSPVLVDESFKLL
jgi:hypothetical protein